jgi:hypothetical protein
MVKKIADKWHKKVQEWSDKEERKNWGERTVVFKSWKEFQKKIGKYCGGLVSPGGAASMLGVNRSYISQLEKEGKITVYRIWEEDIDWDSLPVWIRAISPKREMYGFITADEVERVRAAMIKKAEDKIKRLQGKVIKRIEEDEQRGRKK